MLWKPCVVLQEEQAMLFARCGIGQNRAFGKGVYGAEKEAGRRASFRNPPDDAMSPDRVAQCAVLAMLFELSSSPKPGNVDRCHDFSDIGFHHFLTSAVSAYPVFCKAAQGRGSVGSLILEGVLAWQTWNLSSNTHFGSLVLMIPIAIAAGRPGELQEELRDVLEKTTVIDAIDFYSAFEKAKARVADVDSFSLNDKNWQKAVQRQRQDSARS